MDLLSKTRELCQIYDIHPARSKGQNFLIKEKVYDEIVAAADLKNSDLVLEVGPGLGFLTEKIAAHAQKVIAVELDKKLAEVLQTKIITQKINNVEVVNEDILLFDLQKFKSVIFASRVFQKQPYKIVANLPYNISSIFLRNFLTLPPKPTSLILMLQKEVVERITALPGQMSLLAVSVQLYADAEIIAAVPAADFWPRPEIDSAIIKIKILDSDGWIKKYRKYCPVELLIKDGAFIPARERQFFALVKMGFAAKRKMLKNNLGNGLKMPVAAVEKIIVQAHYNGKIRAQELGVADWLVLFANFSKFVV